jgi:hypothetical protein
MSMPFVQPSAMPTGAFTTGAPIGISTSQPIDDRQMSRLPVSSQPWPPPELDPVSYQMRIHDAWWTGDRQKLAWVYYNLLARRQ